MKARLSHCIGRLLPFAAAIMVCAGAPAQVSRYDRLERRNLWNAGENVAALKENLGWPSQEPFFVPQEVYQNYQELANKGKVAQEKWEAMFVEYVEKYPELGKLWDRYFDPKVAQGLIDAEGFWPDTQKAAAILLEEFRSGKLGRITLEMP